MLTKIIVYTDTRYILSIPTCINFTASPFIVNSVEVKIIRTINNCAFKMTNDNEMSGTCGDINNIVLLWVWFCKKPIHMGS